MTMVKAATVAEAGAPWVVRQIELDDQNLGPQDVLVDMKVAGLCHSDEHVRDGSIGGKTFPLVGGHEGSAQVVAVGSGVSHLEPGDHVVLCFRPACGQCRWCASGRANLCDSIAMVQSGTAQPRFFDRGEPLKAMSLLATFAQRSVVPAISCVRVDKDIPFDVAALLGCAVPTGYGAAVHAAQVCAGDTVLVVGLGGVGTNALQGAKVAGAAAVVGVDLSPTKREIAPEFGADAALETVAQAGEWLKEHYDRKFDVVIMTVGVPGLAEQAIRYLEKAGRVVLAALGDPSKLRIDLPIPLLAMNDITIRGTVMGSASLHRDIPVILDLYRAGKYKLDELISQRLPLEEIQAGYDQLFEGGVTRSVIVH